MTSEDPDSLRNIEKELKVKASFYAGLLSGAIYKAILHPFDTLKAKVLVRNYFHIHFNGLIFERLIRQKSKRVPSSKLAWLGKQGQLSDPRGSRVSIQE